MSLNGGAPTPTTYQHEERPHVCGKCRNGTGVYNPACPNNPRVTVQGYGGGA